MPAFSLDASDEPAAAAEDSDVPAAAMPRPPSGSAPGSPRPTPQVRHGRPSCSRPLARARRRRRLRQRLPCPRRARTPLSLVRHPGSEAMPWFGRILGRRLATCAAKGRAAVAPALRCVNSAAGPPGHGSGRVRPSHGLARRARRVGSVAAGGGGPVTVAQSLTGPSGLALTSDPRRSRRAAAA